MDGIINVLKPPGMTSFDVVGFLRGVLKIKKIGHTGTLDPGAVGVLPVCIGKATKAIEFMMEKDKLYRAELLLGVTTDTQDSCGEIIRTLEVKVTREQIENAVRAFIGKYKQVPPMYSAVKIDGKKLYELARNGIIIEREPREVEIYSIEIISINGPRVLIDVNCSKGTYIRTLCADIGDKLDCGAHMSFLIRKKAGIFDINSAITIEEIRDLHNNNKLSAGMIKIEEVFNNFREVILDEQKEKKILNGVPVKVAIDGVKSGEIFRVYNENGDFVLLGEVVTNTGKTLLKSKKIFM